MKDIYQISDGNATEYAATLEDAESIIEDWYDFLDDVPAPNLDSSSLEALSKSIREWEEKIAENMGKESFAGQGNYYVSAADRAGLRLRVELRD